MCFDIIQDENEADLFATALMQKYYHLQAVYFLKLFHILNEYCPLFDFFEPNLILNQFVAPPPAGRD